MNNHSQVIREQIDLAQGNLKRAESQLKYALDRVTELEAFYGTMSPDDWRFVALLSDASYHYADDSGGEWPTGRSAVDEARKLAVENGWSDDHIRHISSARPQLVDVEEVIIRHGQRTKCGADSMKVAALVDYFKRVEPENTLVVANLRSLGVTAANWYGPKLGDSYAASWTLMEAFLWGETPQGTPYWDMVYADLKANS